MDKKELNEFIAYVMDFYGENGIYDLKATVSEVKRAIEIRMVFSRAISFDFDTVDREYVREIILAVRGV